MNDSHYAAPEHELQKLKDPRPGAGLVKMGVVGLVLLHFLPPVSVVLGAICWNRARNNVIKMRNGELSAEYGAMSRARAATVIGIACVILGVLAMVALLLYIFEGELGLPRHP